MRKLILSCLLLVSSSAFSYVSDPTDVGHDIDSMLYYASLAVHDHAVKNVGMNPDSVRIKYNYSHDYFTASDTHNGCSFRARASISMKRLSTGHHWRVTELGNNNCHQHQPMPH